LGVTLGDGLHSDIRGKVGACEYGFYCPYETTDRDDAGEVLLFCLSTTVVILGGKDELSLIEQITCHNTCELLMLLAIEVC
jgi:hypothetical protein